jgi:hypothetical protein
MLQYLFNAYGNITPLQLDDNDTMMKEQWDPSTPIIYLFSRIQDGVDKADAGNSPYTVNQVFAIIQPRFSNGYHEICMREMEISPGHEYDLGHIPRPIHSRS